MARQFREQLEEEAQNLEAKTSIDPGIDTSLTPATPAPPVATPPPAEEEEFYPPDHHMHSSNRAAAAPPPPADPAPAPDAPATAQAELDLSTPPQSGGNRPQ